MLWRFTVAAAAALCLALAVPAAAHPPAEVALSYDAAAHQLTVRITHGSPLPRLHHIAKVEIRKDGKPLLTTDYASQPAESTFTYTYPIEAGSGGTLEVTATCSLYGSRTQKLDLPQ